MIDVFSSEANDNFKRLIKEAIHEYFTEQGIISGRLTGLRPEDDFINAKEAASVLKISLKTIRQKVSKEEIPYYKPHGILYFKRSELIEMINSGKHKPRAESVNAMVNRILSEKQKELQKKKEIKPEPQAKKKKKKGDLDEGEVPKG